MRKTLRERLAGSEVSVGLAACIVRSVEIATIARSCGFDMLLADRERGPIAIGDAAALSVTGLEAGLPCLVRVSGPYAPDLARVLDHGAEGVVVPARVRELA